jgi:cold shock protein
LLLHEDPLREAAMAKGTVKFFNVHKGYGFIKPPTETGKDVFVHISAVERAGMRTLTQEDIEHAVDTAVDIASKKINPNNLKVSQN